MKPEGIYLPYILLSIPYTPHGKSLSNLHNQHKDLYQTCHNETKDLRVRKNIKRINFVRIVVDHFSGIEEGPSLLKMHHWIKQLLMIRFPKIRRQIYLCKSTLKPESLAPSKKVTRAMKVNHIWEKWEKLEVNHI